MPRPSPKRSVKKGRRKPAAHLLIIECQTSLLHQQQLAIGTPLHRELSAKYPGKAITLAATDARRDLNERLGAIRTTHERYHAILIVAHSNTNGIELTTEDFCNWTTLAGWLKELSPQHLFLIACDAGQLTGICALFAALPSLRKVYASPVPINPSQAQHLTLLVEQVITERQVDETLLRITQGMSFVTSRGVLFQWTRADCQDHNRARSLMQTIGAQFLK